MVYMEGDLIAEIEKLRQQNAELVAALEVLRRYAGETANCWDGGHDATVGKRLLALAGGLPGYSAEVDAALAKAREQA